MKKWMALVLAALLAGCGGSSNEIQIPVQHWKTMDVRIDTHPNPPIAGMSEIVVIVTGPHGRPVSDLKVQMRADNSMPWVQGIQDGLIGVYRRAVDLGNSTEATLQVQLVEQSADQTTLLFPLKLATGG